MACEITAQATLFCIRPARGAAIHLVYRRRQPTIASV
jgi:hypothetical protein